MDSMEAVLSSSPEVSDIKIAVNNSNSFVGVSDDDDIFLNAQEEPVGEEPSGSVIDVANSIEAPPVVAKPVAEKVVPGFDVVVNGGDENLDNDEVLEDAKDVERDEAFLGKENSGREESGGSCYSLDNGLPYSDKVTEVQPGGLEGSGASGGDKVAPDEKLNEFVNPMSEGSSEMQEEKAAEVIVKGQDAAEDDSVEAFSDENILDASPEKSTPNPESFVNDDVENLDTVDVLEGEKVVDRDGALLLDEEFSGSGSSVDASVDKLNADEILNEFVNPMGEEGSGIHQDKVEEEETVEELITPSLTGAERAIVVEETKDVQKQEEVPVAEGVASLINGTVETNQVDPSRDGLSIIGEESENTQQEVVPSVESAASFERTGEMEPLIETVKPETFSLDVAEDVGEEKQSDTIHSNSGLSFSVSTEKISSSELDTGEIPECEDETNYQISGDGDIEGSHSDHESDGMIFGSSEAARQFIEELERESGQASHDIEPIIDGRAVTDSDEEVDTDEEGEGKQLLDSSALAALLKAVTGADSEGGSINITSQDGSKLFSVDRPAGMGSSLRSFGAALQPNRSNLFTPTLSKSSEPEENLSEEEKQKLEKLQQIRVKFLRLIKRLGFSSDESIATQVLYRFSLLAGKQNSQIFNIDTARTTALQLETEGKDDLDFSVNILVIGKSGVGKSATINSILGEERTQIDAFSPTTISVKEICATIDGVKVRVFDTPGLKSSAMEQAFNRSVLSKVKKLTKKNPIDIVLYVDRLDAQTRDLNDLPLLRTITTSLGFAIWRSTIVTLTHAASAPPDGPSGSPLSYEMFVTQRSRVVQQSIGHALGDLHMMSPSLMNPVSLVENHPACRRNREGQRILPNGQIWKPQLLLLCYSMKILSDASSLSKPQDQFDHRKLFGFRARSPPLPYMLSSMLQSRPHPKLSTELGGDSVDSDVDLEDLSDSDHEGEEEEYDQLPPFKPLRRAQIAKLSKEQAKAYFEEYDYRVKLLQKKQWREELRRMREMKKGKDGAAAAAPPYEEDADSGAAAPVAVPLPDMVLPPSFDGDNPTYRYRFLEPTSQFLARPVLDTHGWDHDCGYEGVNIEHSQAIADRFPASVTVQISKDKKDFSISLDSSVSAKHGENGSSMAGFDIQNIGKQLAYVVRGETKLKNLGKKKNKTGGGVSVTFIGENIVTGLKIEDQLTLGKRYVLVGSTGTVRSRHETAYGANLEVQRREADYPIGQAQSTLSMSVIKWRGDLALGLNALAQFSTGRNSKVAVRAGINNKMSGQISVRTSSSDNLSIALTAILPVAVAIYRKLCPTAAEKYSIY